VNRLINLLLEVRTSLTDDEDPVIRLAIDEERDFGLYLRTVGVASDKVTLNVEATD